MSEPLHDVALTPLQEQVAEALEAYERQGRAGLESWCEEHPEDSAAVLRQVHALVGLGLVESADDSRADTAPADRGARPPVSVSLTPGSTRAGLTMGPYHLHEPLGHGGMGVVWRATHADGRSVALKVLAPGLLGSPTARERFRREVAAVGGLQHPTVVPVLDVGEQDGTPYFAMEQVDGPSLAEVLMRVREADLSLAELGAEHLSAAPPPTASRGAATGSSARSGWIEACTTLVSRVADALHHAHGRGVIHRDVKPGNVLLDRQGNPRLVDFGLATTDNAGTLTLTGDFAGTPHYAPPEHVRGMGAPADERTDVYALGVTLYELLTLQRPFEGATNEQVLWQIVHAVPAPLRTLNPRVSRDLATVVHTAMERERSRRYRDARELRDDLERAQRGQTVHARAPGPVSRTLRWARRRPAVSLATTLAVILAVSVPAVLWHGSVQLRREVINKTDQARKAKQVADVLVGMLRSPITTDGQHVRVADKLRQAGETIDAELSRDPDLQIGLRRVIAQSWRSLREPDLARAELERVLELVEQLPPEPPDDGLDIDKADTLLLGGRDFERGRALYDLAGADLGHGDFDAAYEGLVPALEQFVALGDAPLWEAHCLHYLGATQRHRGRLDDAVDLGRRALEVYRDAEASPVHVGRALVTLALSWHPGPGAGDDELERLERKRRLLEEAEAELTRAGDEGAIPLDNARIHLGDALLALGDAEPALRAYDRILAGAEQRYADGEATPFNAAWGRTRALHQLLRHDEALTELDRLIARADSGVGHGASRRTRLRLDHGQVLLESGRLDEAASAFLLALGSARGQYGDGHVATHDALQRTTLALLEARRPAEARQLLAEFEAYYDGLAEPEDDRHLWCLEQLAACADALGEPEVAERWRGELHAARG